ncbi:MAG: DUF4430 domain-containing protein, partial [Candidatus Gribaldobacteria bacterium]|nr:DUF4430 domain-containing protein [Candidatus Gribaldobacteria bacterium]
KIILQIVLVVGVVSVGIYFYNSNKVSLPKSQLSNETPRDFSASDLLPAVESNAILWIAFDAENKAYFEDQVQAKMTVFDLLKQGAEKLKIDLATKDYGEMGILIEKIGDLKNGDNGKSWIYYLNGKMAEVSASKQEIKATDTVEFKFEESKF